MKLLYSAPSIIDFEHEIFTPMPKGNTALQSLVSKLFNKENRSKYCPTAAMRNQENTFVFIIDLHRADLFPVRARLALPWPLRVPS